MTRLILVSGLMAMYTTAFADGNGSAELVPAKDLKWTDVPGMKGVKLAAPETDPSKGPAHFFIKFAPGFTAPLHHHTADHYVTVVQGTITLGVDGKDIKLPPGSFFAFTNGKPHTTTCAPGSECILALDGRGKWDVVPENAPEKQ